MSHSIWRTIRPKNCSWKSWKQFYRLLKFHHRWKCSLNLVLVLLKSVAEVPSSVKMFSESYFIGFVSKNMDCNYLAKKLRQWFNESSDFKNEKKFSFRFLGKESYHFLQHFPMLITSLIQKIDSTDFHFRLFQVFLSVVNVTQAGVIFGQNYS